MVYEIAGSLAVIIGIIVLLYWLEGQGRKAEQNNHMKQVLDDIHRANMARDRLGRDPVAAKRVRKRFTRWFL